MSAVQSSTATRSSTPPPAAAGDSRFVERGQTLSQIARQHGVSVEAMMQANPQIRDADLIYAGDRLAVPSGGSGGSGAGTGVHVVRRGDTLSELAQTYDTDIATLVRLNGIRNPDLIHVNQRLRVPGAGSSGGAETTAPAPGGSGGGSGGGNWMQIARGEMGQAEIAGSRDNQRIVQYHQTTTLRANDDETPWCASFVNWTLEKAGYTGTDSAAAISWATWGDKVNGGVANGREGDVVTIRNRSTGQNHVGFLVRSEGGSFTLLGGNQSNQVKESTYSTASYEVLGVRRPPGGAAAPAPTTPSAGGTPQTGITEAQYAAVARDLGVDVAAIKAVAEVEAAGAGFLPSGKPKILFEAHVFARETGGRYNASHPNLSSPSWNRSLYGAGGEHQWDRFEAAFKLDPEAAIKAASWGRFQIMGFNHQRAGYATPQAFVEGMKRGEGQHLEAFASFIKSDPTMLRALREHDWAAFAYRYNGAGYAQNQYDTKIAQAYARHAR